MCETDTTMSDSDVSLEAVSEEDGNERGGARAKSSGVLVEPATPYRPKFTAPRPAGARATSWQARVCAGCAHFCPLRHLAVCRTFCTPARICHGQNVMLRLFGFYECAEIPEAPCACMQSAVQLCSYMRSAHKLCLAARAAVHCRCTGRGPRRPILHRDKTYQQRCFDGAHRRSCA